MILFHRAIFYINNAKKKSVLCTTTNGYPPSPTLCKSVHMFLFIFSPLYFKIHSTTSFLYKKKYLVLARGTGIEKKTWGQFFYEA